MTNAQLCSGGRTVIWELAWIPKFDGVDFSFLLLVQNTKHVTKFFFVLVVLHFLTNDAAELIEQNVPGTYTHVIRVKRVSSFYFVKDQELETKVENQKQNGNSQMFGWPSD